MNDSFRRALELAREADAEFEALKGLIKTFPGYFWLKEYYPKDNSFRLVAISQALCDQCLGIKAEECEGKLDSEVGGIRAAIPFTESDFNTLNSGVTIRACDQVINPQTGKSCWVLALKWMIKCGERTFVAGFGEKIDV